MKALYLGLALGFGIPQTVYANSWIESLDRWMWRSDPVLKDAHKALADQRWEEAASAYDSYARQHPGDWEEIYNAGVAAYQAKQYKAARTHFQDVIAGAPVPLKSKAAYNSGMASIAEGQLEAARDALRQALAYDGSNQAIKENLAWVEEQLKKEKPKPEEQQDQKQQNSAGQEGQDSQEQKQEQEQAGSDEGKEGQDQKGEPKAGEDKQAQEAKPGDESKASEDKQAQEAKPGGEAKAGEEKSAQEAQAGGEPQASESPKQDKDAKDHIASGRDAPPSKAEDPKGEGKAMAAQSAADPKQAAQEKQDMTLMDMQKQDAERILRSIEDRIGLYPLNQTQRERGENEKDW